MVAGSSELQRRARELCPELRRILDLELEDGNSVIAIKDDWGFIVLLADPFSAEHPPYSKDLSVREVNNRREWKAEINSKTFNHTLACGFGAGWKPPSKMIRNVSLLVLFFVLWLSRTVNDCTR